LEQATFWKGFPLQDLVEFSQNLEYIYIVRILEIFKKENFYNWSGQKKEVSD